MTESRKAATNATDVIVLDVVVGSYSGERDQEGKEIGFFHRKTPRLQLRNGLAFLCGAWCFIFHCPAFRAELLS
jgi:hypothetical protein